MYVHSMCLWFCCLVCLYCWFIYLCYFSNLRRITSSGPSRVNSRCECLTSYLFCSLHVLDVFESYFLFSSERIFLVVYACEHKKMFPSLISEKKKMCVCCKCLFLLNRLPFLIISLLYSNTAAQH